MKSRLFPLLTVVIAVSISSQLSAGTPALAKKSSGGGTPAATTSESKKDLSLKIVSITSPVKGGSDATVVIQTDPDALCKITVKLKSGPASAAGLKAQHADSTGKATWNWKVAKNTSAGEWPVEITASSKGAKGSASGTLKVEK